MTKNYMENCVGAVLVKGIPRWGPVYSRKLVKKGKVTDQSAMTKRPEAASVVA